MVLFWFLDYATSCENVLYNVSLNKGFCIQGGETYRFQLVFGFIELFHELAVVEGLVEHDLLKAHCHFLQISVDIFDGFFNLQQRNKKNQGGEICLDLVFRSTVL